jgi:hypothetical protein
MDNGPPYITDSINALSSIFDGGSGYKTDSHRHSLRESQLTFIIL